MGFSLLCILMFLFTSQVHADDADILKSLAGRGEEARPALIELVKDQGQAEDVRLGALDLLQPIWNNDTKAAAIELLQVGSSALRRRSAEVLAAKTQRGDLEVTRALIRNLNDRDLQVRGACYLALGRVGGPGTEDVIVAGLMQVDLKQPEQLQPLLEALAMFGKAGMASLMAHANSGEGPELDRVLELYSHLRHREAADTLPTMLAHVHASPSQGAALMLSYLNYKLDPPPSVEPVQQAQAAAAKNKKLRSEERLELQLAGLEVLLRRGAVDTQAARAQVAPLLAPGSDLRPHALRIIADHKLSAPVPFLLEALAQSYAPDKVLLVKALTPLGDARAFGPLRTLAQQMDLEPELKQACLAALAGIAARQLEDRSGTHAADLLLADARTAGPMVTALCQHLSGAIYLGQKLARGELPDGARAEVIAALRAFSESSPAAARALAQLPSTP